MRTLLLVEDEAIIALNERRVLERGGFTVQTVHSGEKAISAVRDNPEIDLILMDIDLGEGINGTEAARRILDIRDLPVVFLSSHIEPEYVNQVKEITGYGYVVKNSGEFVLMQSIEMALKLSKAYRHTAAEKERYRLITENINETVITVDSDHNVTYVSPSIERLTGFTPEEYSSLVPEQALTEESARHVRETARRQAENPDESPATLELERWCKDGSTIWTETTARPMQDESGSIIGFVATVRDVQERIRQRQELEKSESRYRSIVENTNDALFVHDFDGIIRNANGRAVELFGYSKDQLIGMSLERLHNASVTEQFRSHISERPWQDRIVTEQDMVTNDGTVIPVEVSAVISSRDGNGEIQAFVRDIRWRKNAESTFYAVYDQTKEAIAMWDRDYRLVHINRAAAASLGKEPDELRGLSIYDLHPKEAADQAVDGMRTVFETGRSRTAEWQVQLDGEQRWFYTHTEPTIDENNQVSHVTSFSTDITEFKRATENYRLIGEYAHDVVAVFDGALVPIYLSPSVERLFGYSIEEFRAQGLFKLIHELDVEQFKKSLFQSHSRREPHGSYELRIVDKTGAIKWVAVSTNRLFDSDGGVDRVVLTARDITDRKQLEEGLRRTSLRLAATLDALPELFFELDEELRFRDYRAADSHELFVAPDEFLGKTVYEVLPPDVVEMLKEAIGAASADRETGSFDYSLSGNEWERFFRASVATRHDSGDQRIVLVLVREVTDLVNTQRRLEAAATRNLDLLREMNHRVKNNLSLVSSLLRLKDAETPGVDLSDVGSQVDAISFVHERLQSMEDSDGIDLPAYLRDIVDQQARLAPSLNIHLEMEALASVTVPGKIATTVGLIVNELANNAVKHAFEAGRENGLRVALSEHTDTYRLEVANTGRPFPEDMRIDQADSLGLQLISGLVGQLAGSIHVTRAPQTVFTVVWPKA